MLVPSVFSSEETGGVSFDRWLVNLHIHSIQKEKIYMNVNETIFLYTDDKDNQYYRLDELGLFTELSICKGELKEKNIYLLGLLSNGLLRCGS